MTERLVLTFEEAGELLAGVSHRTVRRLVDAGELPVVRVAGRVGIPRRALEDVLGAPAFRLFLKHEAMGRQIRILLLLGASLHLQDARARRSLEGEAIVCCQSLVFGTVWCKVP